MLKRRCEYCHELVSRLDYDAHVAQHVKRKADGQQSEYVTLPPEERLAGSLDGVPTVYIHKKCGAGTVMPEEIVRSYLKNPFLYSDGTFCTGCRTHVADRECEWEETGENLQTYMERLRAENPHLKPNFFRKLIWLLTGI